MASAVHISGCEKGRTLDEVRVVGLMWREHSCHLVMVGGMHVFINTVPGQLYLLRIAQVMNRYTDSLRLLFIFATGLGKENNPSAAGGPETVPDAPTRSRKCT